MAWLKICSERLGVKWDNLGSYFYYVGGSCQVIPCKLMIRLEKNLVNGFWGRGKSTSLGVRASRSREARSWRGGCCGPMDITTRPISQIYPHRGFRAFVFRSF